MNSSACSSHKATSPSGDVLLAFECNDDAEQYKWTKFDTVDEKTKKEFYDFWCSEGPLDGEPCLDSRVYK